MARPIKKDAENFYKTAFKKYDEEMSPPFKLNSFNRVQVRWFWNKIKPNLRFRNSYGKILTQDVVLKAKEDGRLFFYRNKILIIAAKHPSDMFAFKYKLNKDLFKIKN
jgi:hypothetical protein